MVLFFGYLFIQFFSLIDQLINASMSGLAMFFSIVVFFIWSFIPFIGYIIAKLINSRGNLSKPILFICGVIGASIEHGLYHFDILHYSQLYMGTFIVFCLFFAVGFISYNQDLTHVESEDV